MRVSAVVCVLVIVGCSATKTKDSDTDGKAFRHSVDTSHSSNFASHHQPRGVSQIRNRRYAGERFEESKIKYCFYTFSAAAKLRRELFFFKGKDFWRLGERSGAKFDKMPMSSFWKNYDGGNIDAVFERPSDQHMVFISGNKYWVYSDPENIVKKSAPIEDFGLRGIDRVDAAVVWEANKRVYLFSGGKFWKLDENMEPEIGYPMNISALPGVPRDLDAAVEDSHGKIYFLKGQRCWNWDDDLLVVKTNESEFIGSKWFGCNRTVYETATQSNSFTGSQLGPGGGAERQGMSFSLCSLAVISWELILLWQK